MAARKKLTECKGKIINLMESNSVDVEDKATVVGLCKALEEVKTPS